MFSAITTLIPTVDLVKTSVPVANLEDCFETRGGDLSPIGDDLSRFLQRIPTPKPALPPPQVESPPGDKGAKCPTIGDLVEGLLRVEDKRLAGSIRRFYRGLWDAEKEVLDLVVKVFNGGGWGLWDRHKENARFLPVSLKPRLLAKQAAKSRKRKLYRYTEETYKKAISRLVRAGLLRVISEAKGNQPREVEPGWYGVMDPFGVIVEAAKFRGANPPSIPSNPVFNPPSIPSNETYGGETQNQENQAVDPEPIPSNPDYVLHSFNLENKERNLPVFVSLESHLGENPLPTSEEKARPWRSGLKRPEGAPSDQWETFTELVREAAKRTTRPRSLYRLANLHLKHFSTDQLIPGYREATSPTAGVRSLLSWLRKRFPIAGVPPWETERVGPPCPFDEFWEAYPRKVGRSAARKAWDKMKPPPPEVLAALEWQSAQPQWNRDNGKFIPHPATWLSQGRWEDEPCTVRESTEPAGYKGIRDYLRSHPPEPEERQHLSHFKGREIKEPPPRPKRIGIPSGTPHELVSEIRAFMSRIENPEETLGRLLDEHGHTPEGVAKALETLRGDGGETRENP